MNTRRKEKLAVRATNYATRKHPEAKLTTVWAAQDGFEDGYRAAMSDMRKELAHADETREPNLPEAIRRTRLLGAIRNFLLPLR